VMSNYEYLWKSNGLTNKNIEIAAAIEIARGMIVYPIVFG